jgi:hypothetical protein
VQDVVLAEKLALKEEAETMRRELLVANELIERLRANMLPRPLD